MLTGSENPSNHVAKFPTLVFVLVLVCCAVVSSSTTSWFCRFGEGDREEVTKGRYVLERVGDCESRLGSRRGISIAERERMCDLEGGGNVGILQSSSVGHVTDSGSCCGIF